MSSWPAGISAITLFVEDLAATKAFYEKAFGLPVHYEDDVSAVFSFGNTLINLLSATEGESLIAPAAVASPESGARVQFTITVDDVDATCAELTANGVELLNGPMDRPWGIRTAAFQDPAGHIWEIAKELARATPRTGPARRLQSAPEDAIRPPVSVRPARRRPAAPGAHPDMISTGELKKGVAIELDGELWQILDYHHIKMGRGSAQVRITLRNIKRGQTVERSFQAGTKWPRASMEKRPVQFLYKDGDDYHFMDNDTYDQFILTTEQLGDTAQYMKDGMTLDRTSYQGETIGVELPVTVDLVVRETEPGFAGDTQTGARKPATTETGLVVTVPIFVEEGDTIRVDTRTGEYQTRV
jgi:elongation factor P